MPYKDAKKCNATTKRTKKQCKGLAVKTSTKCRLHGGKTPKGIASPNYKHGKYSKYAYLPTRLSEKVAEYKNDENLIELRENIAILDARLIELYKQFGENEPAFVWSALNFNYKAWQNAERDLVEADDEEKERLQQIADDAKSEFQVLLNDGVAEQVKAEKVWSNILSTTEQRRKLVDTESKRLKDTNQFITAEQFTTFVQFVTLVIKENVKDQPTINSISDRLISAGATTSRDATARR